MARRIVNRKEMRADYDAAERRKKEATSEEHEESEEEEGEEDEDEDQEEEGDEERGEAESEPEDEEEEEPAPKKKKAPAKPRTRSRVAKVPRMKAVWGVFNNSNARVAVFEYPKRKEAEDLAAKLRNDKKQTHFVQMVKEPMEDKEKEEVEPEKKKGKK
jgi:hypothetical protein